MRRRRALLKPRWEERSYVPPGIADFLHWLSPSESAELREIHAELRHIDSILAT